MRIVKVIETQVGTTFSIVIMTLFDQAQHVKLKQHFFLMLRSKKTCEDFRIFKIMETLADMTFLVIKLRHRQIKTLVVLINK